MFIFVGLHQNASWSFFTIPSWEYCGPLTSLNTKGRNGLEQVNTGKENNFFSGPGCIFDWI